MKLQFMNIAAFMFMSAAAACTAVNAPDGIIGEDAVVDVYEYAPAVIPSMKYSVKAGGAEAFVLPVQEHDVCAFGCDRTVPVIVEPLFVGGGRIC